MQNNIDKYFRKNLEGRQFEMKDAYWEHAQKLLDEEDKRRRRGLIWWWTGGGLGVLLVVMGLYFMRPTENTPAEISQHVELEKNNDTAEEESMGEIESEYGENEEVKNTNEEIVFEKNESLIEVEQKEIEKNRAIHEKGINKNSGLKVDSDFNQNKDEKVEKSEDRIGLNSLNEEKIKQPKVTVEKTDDGRTLISSNGEIYIAEIKIKGTQLVDNISTLDIYVESENEGEGDEDLELLKTDTPKKKKVSFAVAGAQYFQVQPDSGEQNSLAIRASALLKYKWSEENNFYLMTGLSYERRTGTFDVSKTAETRNYRFGLEAESNFLRPSSLHTLSLPVLLGYEKKRHVLETGFSVDYLSGVRGEKGSIERIPDSNPPRRDFVASESGWIKEEGFNRLIGSLHFNYRLKVNTQWSFGLSAKYNLRGIVDDEFEFNQNILREDDKFMLGLQAVYMLR